TWRILLEGGLLEARAGNVQIAREVFKYLLKHVPWYGPVFNEAFRFEERYEEHNRAALIVEKGEPYSFFSLLLIVLNFKVSQRILDMAPCGSARCVFTSDKWREVHLALVTTCGKLWKERWRQCPKNWCGRYISNLPKLKRELAMWTDAGRPMR